MTPCSTKSLTSSPMRSQLPMTLRTSPRVPMHRVVRARRTDHYWQRVLDRAGDEGLPRVDAVLDVALARSDRPGLATAIDEYRRRRSLD